MSPSLGAAPEFPAARLRHAACTSVMAYAERLAGERRWPTLECLQERFADRLVGPPPVMLAPPAPSPRGRRARRLDELYEMQIAEHARLPTRPESWHDLMNVLVWCAFPRSKRALVERHRRAILEGPPPRRGVAAARTPERDALSILDEGGAVVLCRAGTPLRLEVPGALDAALAGGEASVRIFGHALLEAAVTGALERRDLRAAGVVFVVEDPHATAMDEVDRALAGHLADPRNLRAPDRRASFWLHASGALRAVS
jgi:hypothetical protein